MNIRNKFALVALTLALGAVAFYFLAGIALGVIFALLWIDKIIIGSIPVVRKFGVEVTTIATIFLGIVYGPVIAFVFSLVFIPALHAIKFIILPMPSEWPLFVPSPYNVADAIGAAIAGLLQSQAFMLIMVAVLISKILVYAFVDRIFLSKPVDIIGAVGMTAFNLMVMLPIAGYFASVTGVHLKL